MKYYLSIGSNIENRLNYLKTGIYFLKRLGIVDKISKIYETVPVGVEEIQADYLNLVITLIAELSPPELLKELKSIEARLGRDIYRGHLKPRELDVDILFCDDLVFSSENLQIPHPGIANRRFVLIPLCDIAPELVHPVEGKSVSELLAQCTDTGEVHEFQTAIDF